MRAHDFLVEKVSNNFADGELRLTHHLWARSNKRDIDMDQIMRALGRLEKARGDDLRRLPPTGFVVKTPYDFELAIVKSQDIETRKITYTVTTVRRRLKLGAGQRVIYLEDETETPKIRMAKIERTGQIVQILRHEDRVKFSDDTGWFLVNTEPGRRTGTGVKWIPDSTRFAWVKNFENLKEAFDQPYPLTWEKSEADESVDALARLPDGSNLSIMFNQDLDDEGQGIYSVEFWRNNSQEVTGAGDSQRVFATVLAAIAQFIKKRKPEQLYFSANKDVEPGQKAGSRSNLYTSLVRRYATALGYEADVSDFAGSTTYKLYKLYEQKQVVAEARLPAAIEEFLDSLNPDDCGVEDIGAYRIHFEGFTSDCKSSADYRRDPEAVYQQVYQDFIQREGGARPIVQDMTGDEDFPILYSIFRRPINEVNYPDELRVGQQIQDHFLRRGYQLAGEGRDQMAFFSPRNTVVKVLGIGESEREEIVKRYVSFFVQNQRNPYYPRIYNTGDFEVDGETYFVYEQEYLNYVANEEATLDYLEKLMAAVDRGYAQEFMEKNPLPKELDEDELYGLLETTEDLIEALGGHAPLDLSNIENLRRREDGHLVIMDPFSL